MRSGLFLAVTLMACGAEAGDGDGEAAVAPSVSACVSDAEGNEPSREILTLTGDSLSVGIVRSVDPDALPGADTRAFVLERFAYARGDVEACVTEPAQLDYVVSHHNFADEITAMLTAGTVRVHAELSGVTGPVQYRIDVPSAGGTPDSVALALVSCRVPATGEDCRARYE